jgi:hypothetical protein
MLAPDTYYPANRALLSIRLIDITCELAEAYTQRHTAQIAWTKARHDSYNHHYSESEAAKKRICEQETYYLEEAVQDLDTQILVYQEERDLLRFLIGQING